MTPMDAARFAAELESIEAALAAEKGHRYPWAGSIRWWGTVAGRFEAGYGTKGHGLVDLLFELQGRDAAQDCIDRASAHLAKALGDEIHPIDEVYLANTVEWPRLLDYLDSPPPLTRWWWYRMPSWGPAFDVECRLVESTDPDAD